jgi:AcrR family transcriptional regulator
MIPERGPGRPRDPRLDNAIMQATIDLLGKCGYEALSMEGVASRAGTTKTAIYRRWPSKAALVADVFESRAKTNVVAPQTGDLRQDLLAHVSGVINALTAGPGGAAVLNMVAAARAHPDLAELLQQGWIRVRRRVVSSIFEAAAARGDIGPDVDVDLLSDLLIGPIYYRLLVTNEPVQPSLAPRLVDAVMATIRS